MIGQHRLLNELAWLVKRSPAETTTVSAQAATRRVSRFANRAIHQDIAQETLTVYVKVVTDRRVGVAVTTNLERASLRRALKAAMDIAQHTPRVRQLPELPHDTEFITTQDYVPQTAQAPPSHFIGALTKLFQLCQGAGASLAGSCSVGEDEMAVVNSRAVTCYAASTVAGAKLVTMYRKLSGFASDVHRHVDHLDLEQLLEDALKQSLHRGDPLILPTGTYEVILEPEAVAELVSWLGYIAFGAKSLQERTSFLAGRMGEPVMGPQITITDDGSHSEGLRAPFDFEGVPRQSVTLIDRGKATGIVYDTTYGQLYDHPSTGHAPPPNDVDGPMPAHLLISPGTVRRTELIRRCRRGILIPRFHYVSGLLNPREALMTGLTREGACLIEHGKPKRPITTMRFTQSCLEAFQHVLGVSKERRLIADPTQGLGCAVMPTLHLAKFRFTGHSEG